MPIQVVIRLDRGIHPGQTVSPPQDTDSHHSLTHSHSPVKQEKSPADTRRTYRLPDSGIFSLRGAIVPEKPSSVNPKTDHVTRFSCANCSVFRMIIIYFLVNIFTVVAAEMPFPLHHSVFFVVLTVLNTMH